MFGSTCSMVMRKPPLPEARAASTNSRAQIALADATGHPDEGWNLEDADGGDRSHHARACDGRQHDRREHRGKREREVAHPHDELFGPALARGGNQPEVDAKSKADPDRDDADHDGGAGAYQEQRDDIATKHVGAEPVRSRRWPQLGRHVDLIS